VPRLQDARAPDPVVPWALLLTRLTSHVSHHTGKILSKAFNEAKTPKKNPKEVCIIRESNTGPIDTAHGNDGFYH
jgi:hypothetical protein